jgi:hypothetical protein
MKGQIYMTRRENGKAICGKIVCLKIGLISLKLIENFDYPSWI